MKALTWQGKRKIGYGEVPDPQIQEPTWMVAPSRRTRLLHRWGNSMAVTSGRSRPPDERRRSACSHRTGQEVRPARAARMRRCRSA
jgi:hypothetical protein